MSQPAIEKGKPGNPVAAEMRKIADLLDAGTPLNVVIVHDAGWAGTSVGSQAIIVGNLFDAMCARREDAKREVGRILTPAGSAIN